jgi:thioredoxin 1
MIRQPRQEQCPSMSDRIIHITDASFEKDVLNADKPVMVDYWAEWCGPCKMIAPILDEIATEYDGKLTIAKLNIDENQPTALKYGVRGIPTLMIFKDGEIAGTKVGALSKSQLSAFIDSVI